MRKSSISAAVLSAAAALALAACGSSGGGSTSSSASTPAGGASSSTMTSGSSSSASTGGAVNGNGTKVGIILPDTTSSPRWVTADPQALQQACSQYKLSCDIKNANGSPQTMKSIAEQMESNGVKALVIVNLDQASGAAIEKEATQKGVIPVDYDRLTPGGGAAVYVSFNGVTVGQVQGKTLTQCPQVKNQKSVQYVDIDGAPTDNNALLFAQGYDSVLSKQPGWTRVAKQTGNWDGPTAGRVFSQMLNKNPNIKAVMSANDTMAQAVITDLKSQNLVGKVAVGGQDATAGGLQNIMAGSQCFTIYKPSAKEAFPAMKAVAQLVNGQQPSDVNATTPDPVTKNKVPSILATPIAITKANVAQPINDGYTPKKSVCTGQYVSLCKQNGVK
jgi:D-xylose transport system substrate-binding protein